MELYFLPDVISTYSNVRRIYSVNLLHFHGFSNVNHKIAVLPAIIKLHGRFHHLYANPSNHIGFQVCNLRLICF